VVTQKLVKQKKRLFCDYAARRGYKDLLAWGRENGCTWSETTCASAARGGHLEILKWCREEGCPWDKRTFAYAAKSGNLETFQWVVENRCPYSPQGVVYAAQRGYVKILQWMRNFGFLIRVPSLRASLGAKNIEVIKWCCSEGESPGKPPISSIYPLGRPDLNDIFRFNSLEEKEQTKRLAKVFENPEEVSNLLPSDISSEFLGSAAENGRRDIFEALQAHGAPWKVPNLSIWLALDGHLSLLQWAIEKGCQWSPDKVLKVGVEGGRVEVVRWAREQGGRLDLSEMVQMVLTRGHLELLKWLKKEGAELNPDDYLYAVINRTRLLRTREKKYVKMFEWMENEGIPVGRKEDCLEATISQNGIDLFNFFKGQFKPEV
jgi:hypothetical protein